MAGILVVSLTACTALNTNINPDDSKRPAPLFVRLYELKSDKQFSNANFIDLYERDKEVLGADMIAKQRLKRIAPGETRKDEYVLDTQTRYVGLFAEFSQYKDASFKIIIPVASTNVIASSAIVSVSGNRISVTH
jgi:type VI secretion system protein VasD